MYTTKLCRDTVFTVSLLLTLIGCNPNTNQNASLTQGLPQQSLIIDTDCGPDDLMAIAFLLQIDSIEIEAITTSYGLADVQRGARNICRVLTLAERAGIPVYVGQPEPLEGQRKFPLSWIQDSEDFSEHQLPNTEKRVEPISAHAFLSQRLRGKPVDILTLGALTNIAKVLKEVPHSTNSIRKLVIMGGSVQVEGNVFDVDEFTSPSDSVEWNLFVDPKATDIVFSADIPIHLVPLDATNYVPIDTAFLNRFSENELSPTGRFTQTLLENIREYAEAGQYFAWDPLAAIVWLKPDFTQNQKLFLDVNMKEPHTGQTYISSESGRAINVAVKASQTAFNEVFIKSFILK